jgi:hypothetical protein
VYFPVASGNAAIASLLVRVRVDTAGAKAAIERAAQEVAPGQTDLVSSLEEVLQTTGYPFRAAFWAGSSLAALAMVLVVSGIYGVLSFMVSHRQKEIGIRLALGASKRDVVKLILGQSVRLRCWERLWAQLRRWLSHGCLPAISRCCGRSRWRLMPSPSVSF